LIPLLAIGVGSACSPKSTSGSVEGDEIPDPGALDSSAFELDTGVSFEDTGTREEEDIDPDQQPPLHEFYGHIGSACETDFDCDYEGGVCLTEGFHGGLCSMACDRYCPDSDGDPVTFCVELPEAITPDGDNGWCVARCDFSAFPANGCRDGYGCRIEERYNEPETQTYACGVGVDTDLTDCHFELADRGIGFEPTVRQVDHPDGRPDVDCRIEDPVWVQSPLFGVDLKYYDGSITPRTLASCEMAQALADTVIDLLDRDVASLLHVGTYNCRMISGTDTVSRHGFADAIDIYGFEFTDGEVWTLIDDWEHDTEHPSTAAGAFMYEAAHRWYDEWIWDIILTPNYNASHDNHFHVDLSPGSHYIGFTDGRFVGPAPYAD
jgi:hypothetical protein